MSAIKKSILNVLFLLLFVSVGYSSAMAATPKLTSMVTNQGWMITFFIPGQAAAAKEIFYALDKETDYTSTGLQNNFNQQTGERMPQLAVVIPDITMGDHFVSLKYKDTNDNMQGPYKLTFNTLTEMITSAKEELNFYPWISHEAWNGTQIYFSNLLNHKGVIKEIKYSLDNESLDQNFPFEPWDKASAPVLMSNEKIWINVPAATKYIAIKLIFKDGTESEIKKFNKAQ